MSKTYLAHISAFVSSGSHKVTVHVGNGFQFLADNELERSDVIIGTSAGLFSRNSASGCTTRSPPGRAYLDAGDAGGVPVDPLPAHMRAQGDVRWAVPGVRIFDGTHLPLWPDGVHGLPEGDRAGRGGDIMTRPCTGRHSCCLSLGRQFGGGWNTLLVFRQAVEGKWKLGRNVLLLGSTGFVPRPCVK